MPLSDAVMEEGLMEAKTIRSKQEALDELNREFNVRRRCFARWIENGRLSATDAQDRLDRLASAIDMLESGAVIAVPVHVSP
jgi:hypothetical protein